MSMGYDIDDPRDELTRSKMKAGVWKHDPAKPMNTRSRYKLGHGPAPKLGIRGDC